MTFKELQEYLLELKAHRQTNAIQKDFSTLLVNNKKKIVNLIIFRIRSQNNFIFILKVKLR